jgi:hypothetical protein
VREFVAAIAHRGFNAFATFFYGVVREADHVEVVHMRGTDVDLNFHEVGVDAVDGGA